MAKRTPYTGALIGDVATTMPMPKTPAAVPVAVPAAAPAPIDQIKTLYPDFYAQNEQIKAAASQVLPMYQARLGGLQGPAADGMRLQSQQAIQSQYGNALRAATSQAGAQGVRGPAAIAMQNDIRNQMGQATANYNRDLTVSDWDAKRQALGDYYSALGTERGGVLGTLGGLQQQINTDKGFNSADKMIAAQLAGLKNGGSNGGGMLSNVWNMATNPQRILGLPDVPTSLNPVSRWLGGAGL